MCHGSGLSKWFHVSVRLQVDTEEFEEVRVASRGYGLLGLGYKSDVRLHPPPPCFPRSNHSLSSTA